MKKFLTVLFLCSTLIVSSQRVLNFNTLDVLTNPTTSFSVDSSFILEEKSFTLFIEDVEETYTIESEGEFVEIKNHSFIGFVIKSSSGVALIAYFKKDMGGVIIAKKDGSKEPVVFYNK